MPYAVLAAAICGVGIPLYWTVVVRRRPISDLGLTTHRLGLSLILLLVLAMALNLTAFAQAQLPPFEQLTCGPAAATAGSGP